jgi:hypothetical protein
MRYAVCGSNDRDRKQEPADRNRNRAEARPLRRKAPALEGGRYNGDGRRGDLSVIWGTNGERRSYHLQSVRVYSLLWSPKHEK